MTKQTSHKRHDPNLDILSPKNFQNLCGHIKDKTQPERVVNLHLHVLETYEWVTSFISKQQLRCSFVAIFIEEQPNQTRE